MLDKQLIKREYYTNIVLAYGCVCGQTKNTHGRFNCFFLSVLRPIPMMKSITAEYSHPHMHPDQTSTVTIARECTLNDVLLGAA